MTSYLLSCTLIHLKKRGSTIKGKNFACKFFPFIVDIISEETVLTYNLAAIFESVSLPLIVNGIPLQRDNSDMNVKICSSSEKGFIIHVMFLLGNVQLRILSLMRCLNSGGAQKHLRNWQNLLLTNKFINSINCSSCNVIMATVI